MKTNLPYGSWPSKLTSSALAKGAIRLSEPTVFNNDIYWLEGRPEESGRTAIVKYHDETASTLGPADLNVRTLVHEYGGGSWLPTSNGILLTSLIDQRIWLLNGDLQPITSSPSDSHLRFANGTSVPNTTETVWVVERHRDGSPTPDNLLATVTLDGHIEEIATGADFYSSPVVSPDGESLAYLSWNHPSMPWDHVRLHLAKRIKGKWRHHQILVDGPALQQPKFSPEGELHIVSDETGWWNIHKVDLENGLTQPIFSAQYEFGVPGWVFGQQTYAWSDDAIWCTWIDKGTGHIGRIVESELLEVDCGLTEFNGLSMLEDGRAVTVAASWTSQAAVVIIAADGSVEKLNNSQESPLPSEEISTPTTMSVPDLDGDDTYCFYFAPLNSKFFSQSELPPLILLSHGGPTGAARSSYDLAIQFWTNRGFAVVDVNYRGSTGFGTEYRNKLRRKWGIADTEDCVGAARFLANQGLADPKRLVIKGGSAGGYTTLRALTTTDVFAAGISRYGVADLATLAEDTHKFEARYLDSLVGEWPAERDIYDERSPIHHADRLVTPMIVLQGSEDPVVPPSQAEQLVDALQAAGIPHSYVLFAGESHGFRQAETISAALDAELSFLGQILGFEPHDEITPITIL